MKCAVYQSTRRGRRVHEVNDFAAEMLVSDIAATILNAAHDGGYFYSARFKLAEMNEDDGLRAAEHLYKLTQNDFFEGGDWTQGEEIIYSPSEGGRSSSQVGDIFMFRSRDRIGEPFTMRVYVVLNIGCIEIGGPDYADEIAKACVNVRPE